MGMERCGSRGEGVNSARSRKRGKSLREEQ